MDILSLGVAASANAKAEEALQAIESIGSGIAYKGAVNYYKDLPNNAKVGDAYTVKYKGTSGDVADGSEYVWGKDGLTNKWIKLGPDLDFTQEDKNKLDGIEANANYYVLPNDVVHNQDLIWTEVDLFLGTAGLLANKYYKHIGATGTYINGVVYFYNGTDILPINGSGSTPSEDNTIVLTAECDQLSWSENTITNLVLTSTDAKVAEAVSSTGKIIELQLLVKTIKQGSTTITYNGIFKLSNTDLLDHTISQLIPPTIDFSAVLSQVDINRIIKVTIEYHEDQTPSSVITGDIKNIVTKAQLGLNLVENKSKDTTVTEGSDNYVSSDAVFQAIHDALPDVTGFATKTELAQGLAEKISTKPDSVNELINSNNKINTSYIPDVLIGQVKYQGTFLSALPLDAHKGDYYIFIGTEATIEGLDFVTGDWAVYNGSTWDKIDNTDAVQSVNGKTGAVVLNKSDVGLGNVDNTSDLNKPISNAAAAQFNKIYNELKSLGVYEGANYSVGTMLYFNTLIGNEYIGNLSSLTLTETTEVEGTTVNIAAKLLTDSDSTHQGIYWMDFSQVGGSGYSIIVAHKSNGNWVFDDFLWFSEINSTNEHIITTMLLPGYQMPTEPGWATGFYTLQTALNSVNILDGQPAYNDGFKTFIQDLISDNRRLWDLIEMTATEGGSTPTDSLKLDGLNEGSHSSNQLLLPNTTGLRFNEYIKTRMDITSEHEDAGSRTVKFYLGSDLTISETDAIFSHFSFYNELYPSSGSGTVTTRNLSRGLASLSGINFLDGNAKCLLDVSQGQFYVYDFSNATTTDRIVSQGSVSATDSTDGQYQNIYTYKYSITHNNNDYIIYLGYDASNNPINVIYDVTNTQELSVNWTLVNCWFNIDSSTHYLCVIGLNDYNAAAAVDIFGKTDETISISTVEDIAEFYFSSFNLNGSFNWNTQTITYGSDIVKAVRIIGDFRQLHQNDHFNDENASRSVSLLAILDLSRTTISGTTGTGYALGINGASNGKNFQYLYVSELSADNQTILSELGWTNVGAGSEAGWQVDGDAVSYDVTSAERPYGAKFESPYISPSISPEAGCAEPGSIEEEYWLNQLISTDPLIGYHFRHTNKQINNILSRLTALESN